MIVTLAFPATTSADQTSWRVNYSVNGTSDRPDFSRPVADTQFELPGPNGGVLNHGDSVDVHLFAVDGAGNESTSSQLVFTVLDTFPPPQPASAIVVSVREA
jgi:hypothetical protein